MQTSDLYDSVTSNIIADLEKGVAPWVKPWNGGNSGGIMPINAATRRHYTGINVLILWPSTEVRSKTEDEARSLDHVVKKY